VISTVQKESVTSAEHGSTDATNKDGDQAVTSTTLIDKLKEPASRKVAISRAISRPVPQQQVKDPRAFQISQIRTRFSAVEEEQANSQTELRFKMAPSDPDFPFDIDSLDCALRLPAGFPQKERPTLRVTNKVMERGYQINVERGFDAIWLELRDATLLNAMKVLDRQLELLLTGKKADTIKLVTNAGPRPPPPKPTEPIKPVEQPTPPIVTKPTPSRPAPPTAERKAQAVARRQAETQTLEHRLGKNPLFTKGGDGTIFTVPVDPRKRSELPPSLQAIKSVRLFVPESYDIEPCTIELLGVTGDSATDVEKAFVVRAEQNPSAPLLAQVNYLAQNLHILAKPVEAAIPVVLPAPAPELPKVEVPEPLPAQPISRVRDDDKSHIVHIPRPPEWSTGAIGGDTAGESTAEDSDSESSYYSDSDEEHNDEDIKAPQADDTSSTPREKGISVSFPSLEFHGIELLELVSVSLTVKCERCKDTLDIANVRENTRGDYAGVRNESCKKCAFAFGIGLYYRLDIARMSH